MDATDNIKISFVGGTGIELDVEVVPEDLKKFFSNFENTELELRKDGIYVSGSSRLNALIYIPYEHASVVFDTLWREVVFVFRDKE